MKQVEIVHKALEARRGVGASTTPRLKSAVWPGRGTEPPKKALNSRVTAREKRLREALEAAKSELRDYHYEHPTMKKINEALEATDGE